MTQGTVLIVEDDKDLREALVDTLALAGYDVQAAADGREALAAIDDAEVALVVSDIRMQPMDGHQLLRHIKARRADLPVLLMTAYGTIPQAVDAMRNGAVDYLIKPFEAESLVTKVAAYLRASAPLDADMLVPQDPSMRELMSLARRVAENDVTVLITGESGTGKEVLARFIHRHSRRADRPFVAINCAAIPENMLEALLFGYEKGAFTGAYQSTPGKFEQAQGGTLLLDEISEMSLPLQAKLLRVLQEREVERLGGRKTIALDVRVLATSNRNMREEVTARRFREDLYYRLNVFPLRLPPLRERGADIVALARHLARRHAQAAGQPVSEFAAAAEAALLAYRWPGNVRELDNVVQRALILAGAGPIEAAHLNFESAAAEPAALPAATRADEPLGDDLKSRERRLILEALQAGGGSRKYAAEKLGLSPRTLRYKLARMREAGIEIPGHSLADFE